MLVILPYVENGERFFDMFIFCPNDHLFFVFCFFHFYRPENTLIQYLWKISPFMPAHLLIIKGFL